MADTELPNPNLTDTELKAVMLNAAAVVHQIEESATTHLIVELCKIIVSQRLALIELGGAPSEPTHVAQRLTDSFLEGLDEAIGRDR